MQQCLCDPKPPSECLHISNCKNDRTVANGSDLQQSVVQVQNLGNSLTITSHYRIITIRIYIYAMIYTCYKPANCSAILQVFYGCGQFARELPAGPDFLKKRDCWRGIWLVFVCKANVRKSISVLPGNIIGKNQEF